MINEIKPFLPVQKNVSRIIKKLPKGRTKLEFISKETENAKDFLCRDITVFNEKGVPEIRIIQDQLLMDNVFSSYTLKGRIPKRLNPSSLNKAVKTVIKPPLELTDYGYKQDFIINKDCNETLLQNIFDKAFRYLQTWITKS